MTETTAKTNAQLAREYVDDAMLTGGYTGTLTHEHGRDAVLKAAKVLAVLATADALRPQPPVVMVNAGSTPMSETGRILLRRQIERAQDSGQLPEHEIKVGDPDPTPNHGPHCREGAPSGMRRCTCRPIHKPPHVAGNGAEVIEVWS